MTEAGHPADLGVLEKSVNEAAARAGGLWFSFITIAAYLAIATGSVTHRDLLLNSSIALPVLNVQLPPTGFFVVAPLFFVLSHFYLLVQLHGLGERIRVYEAALSAIAPHERRLMRLRLDSFVFVNALSGRREESYD